MIEVTTDDRGRVTLPKAVRERFGQRYRLVELRDEVRLIPIPEDPVDALRGAASDELRDAALDDLRDAALETGREQAEEHVR